MGWDGMSWGSWGLGSWNFGGDVEGGGWETLDGVGGRAGKLGVAVHRCLGRVPPWTKNLGKHYDDFLMTNTLFGDCQETPGSDFRANPSQSQSPRLPFLLFLPSISALGIRANEQMEGAHPTSRSFRS